MFTTIDQTQEIQKIAIGGARGNVAGFSFPIRDIQCYWMPELRTPSPKIHWRIACQSSGVCNFPFISFFNISGLNRIAIMVDTLDDDCEIFCRMNQKDGLYEVTVTLTSPVECTLTLDRRERQWQELLADYRDSLPLPAPHIPPGAWQPVFCSWYAVHTGVSTAWLEANGQIAAALGFGTLIVDDGWSFDRVKRHCPELIDSWYENIGDWLVSGKKLPAFREHVKKIKSCGLNYMLWIAPPIIGLKSDVRKSLTADDLDTRQIDGSHRLLPRRRETMDMMADKFAELMKKYDLDGLKIDYLDFFKPDCEAPQGRAMRAFARLISEKIRAVKNDALIEYRQFYTVPGMLQFATQYRAGDVPYDWLDNFNRLAQMRTTLGDNLPLHADPAFWRDDEPLKNIGKHMISTLCGVPMISMDLEKMPPEQQRIVKTYLDLYRQYLPCWQHGHWEVQYLLGNVTHIKVRHQDQLILFVNDACRLDNDATLIFNLSPEELSLPDIRAFDAQGHTAPNIPEGGFGISHKASRLE